MRVPPIYWSKIRIINDNNNNKIPLKLLFFIVRSIWKLFESG